MHTPKEITIDSDNGVDTDLCVKVTKIINPIIDELNLDLNDYILDGMPCDRVNEVIISEENIVKWVRNVCVHKSVWEKENVSVDLFYNLRGLWIESFVNTISSDFKYVEGEENTFTIERN